MTAVEKLSTRTKKPMNCFMLWAQQARKQVSLKDPTLDASGIATRLGAMWKHLPDTAKEPYIRQAKRLKTVFAAKCNAKRGRRMVTSTCRCKHNAPEVRSIGVQCNSGECGAVDSHSHSAIPSCYFEQESNQFRIANNFVEVNEQFAADSYLTPILPPPTVHDDLVVMKDELNSLKDVYPQAALPLPNHAEFDDFVEFTTFTMEESYSLHNAESEYGTLEVTSDRHHQAPPLTMPALQCKEVPNMPPPDDMLQTLQHFQCEPFNPTGTDDILAYLSSFPLPPEQ